MKTITCLSLALFSCCVQAAYDGPSDPAMKREPNSVLCNGIPSYPKGANLKLPKLVSTGNLQDGYSVSLMAGSTDVMVFRNMTLSNKNTLKGDVSIVYLDQNRLETFKTTCTVKSWH